MTAAIYARKSTEQHEPKRRRAPGSGSISRKRRVWWISYLGADGLRHAESSGSERKGNAERLCQQRVGARKHNVPVIPRAEQLRFAEAARAVINDFVANAKRSLAVVKRRIEIHVQPYFGGRRLAGITRDDVTAYITHRQQEGIVAARGASKGERIGDVSKAEVNREVQILKRIFNLAIEGGRIAFKPRFKLLDEASPRVGFFEREQIDGVLAHLPAPLRPVIEFAYLTGWRIASEILPLEWRHVDLKASEVQLDAGTTTKNKDGHVFPLTRELRMLLEAQKAEHDRLKQAGTIGPWVFYRMVAKGRGGEKSPKRIVSFNKAWKSACRAAGCPGRLPHDLRRTAVRNLVRAGIPERVAMMMTGHKTRSVFERYDIVSAGDLREAARRLDAHAEPAASHRQP